jgi:hypothetical protein
MAKYDLPVDSLAQALDLLKEAERRYAGKVVLDEKSNFPLIRDDIGACYTDEVLRAIGDQYGSELDGKFPCG